VRSSSTPRASQQVETFIVPANGGFPNNDRLPVVLYRGAFDPAAGDLAGAMEGRFQEHGWSGGWRNGIYPFAHYHGTTHEVLGIAAGQVAVQLGGPGGRELTLRTGDVVVLPAGVAHRNLDASADLLVIGAYPGGRRWDMNRGEPGERPGTDERIAQVPLPDADPLFGEDGPLLREW
jgi:uncharacterized protein YjlB